MSEVVQNINDPNLFLNANAVGDFNDKTSDTSGYGSLPGVEQNQTYFAYYDGAGRQDPELPKQTTFFIKYLIDSNGNIVKPQPNDTSVINIVDNFETGKPVIITTKTPTTQLNVLLGEKTVTHVGELSTLLVTNTGSGKMDYITTMSFQNLLGISLAQTASDYNMAVRANNSSNSWVVPYPSDPEVLTFPGVAITSSINIGDFLNFNLIDNPPDSPAATWNPTNGTYTFNKNTNPDGNSRVRFALKFNAMCYYYKHIWATSTWTDNNQNFNPDRYKEINVRIRIQLNGEDLYTSSPRTINNLNKQQYIYAETPFYNFLENDEITFWLDPDPTWSSQINYGFFQDKPDFKSVVIFTQAQGGFTGIKVINENQNISGLIDGATAATANFFTIGEYPDQYGDPNAIYTSTSVITASQGLTNMYREGTVQTLPSSVLSASYAQPWQSFYPLLPGDRIIFENNKNNVHTITEVIPSITSSNGSSSFGLRVVPGITTGSIVNNFCIYRILNNGSQIMVDQEKPTGTAELAFRGFIRPKYISQELETKFIDIINKLENDGIIT